MSRSPKTTRGLTLEEFLRLPEIDEPPYQEYIEGRVEEKPLPKKQHGLLQARIVDRLNRHAEPLGLGFAFPELRCTFSGRSIVPDVVFLTDEHIPVDDRGRPVNETFLPPDIQVEIASPDQPIRKTHRKLLHASANGCPLGVLIHPEDDAIDVYRPGRTPERLADDGVVDFAPVLPGFRPTVAEVLSWLVYRRPNPPDPGAGR